MADTVTANLGLVKPEISGSNNSWGTKLNADMDVIDAAIQALRDGKLDKSVRLTKAANYLVVKADASKWIECTAAITLTFDPAATLGASWEVWVIARGGDVVLDPASNIDGAASVIIPNGTFTKVLCDGAVFYTLPVINIATLLADKVDIDEAGTWVIGLTLSNNVANPNTHIDFGTGSTRNGNLFVANAASITKRLNANFAAGSGNGGLDTGAVAANQTYFCFALRKDSDGSFDVVLSTSSTSAGVNLGLLTGYTIIRRIGVILTDGSSNVRQFVMYPNDEYQFVTPIRDASNIATTLTSTLLAITAPNGVKVKAKLRFMFRSPATTNSCLVYDPAKGTLTAGGADEGGVVGTPQVADGYSVGNVDVWTNTAKQVRHVAGATGSLWVFNDGFYFPCGRIS